MFTDLLTTWTLLTIWVWLSSIAGMWVWLSSIAANEIRPPTHRVDIGGKLYDGEDKVVQLSRDRAEAVSDVGESGEDHTAKHRGRLVLRLRPQLRHVL